MPTDTDTVSPPGGDEIKAITRNGKPIPVTSRLMRPAGRYLPAEHYHASVVMPFDAGDEIGLPSGITVTIVEPGTCAVEVREGEPTPVRVARIGDPVAPAPPQR